jgi:hypothetical protein
MNTDKLKDIQIRLNINEYEHISEKFDIELFVIYC